MSHALAFMTPSPLPRGGVVVLTSVGPVQFSAPPETIKDTLTRPEGVANVFVLAPDFFDYNRGVSLAETEFPTYFNFFIKQKRIRLVCTAAQEVRVRQIMQESLFGPETIDIERELPPHPQDRSWRPDLPAEFAHFRKSPIVGGRAMRLEDLVEFVRFDPDMRAAHLDGLRVEISDNGGFILLDQATQQEATIPGGD